MDFSKMIYKLIELPRPEISIKFTNFKSFADSFNKYFDQDEESL